MNESAEIDFLDPPIRRRWRLEGDYDKPAEIAASIAASIAALAAVGLRPRRCVVDVSIGASMLASCAAMVVLLLASSPVCVGGRSSSAAACMDSTSLVEHVRERVAGLDEQWAVDEVVAALQRQDPDACVTGAALEERERVCGAQGLKDAVRAVQMFALGLDAVPAPIQPSTGVPCVQIPSSPHVVVLEWSHQADSLQRVRGFDVQREPVGGGRAEARNLTTAEFEKCRNKGRCTFHDVIEPGRHYIYSVSATNALGTSAAVEIFCATRDYSSSGPAGARCSPGDAAFGEADDGASSSSSAAPMSVSSTVAWCIVSAAVAGGLTVFLLDRAVVNGNSQLCDTISRRMNSSSDDGRQGGPVAALRAADSGRFEMVMQEIYGWKAMILLAVVYSIGIWMWLPVELQLLPTLRTMGKISQQYIARDMKEEGQAHSTHEVFAAVQGSGQSAILVADSYDNFAVSAHEWEHGLLALHREQRSTITSMLDGTTEIWQPESMALFLCGILSSAYVLELCVWTKWLWEGTRLKEMLQYTSRISPGCKLGRYLVPLCCLGCLRTYAVIDAAIALAGHMRRNVDQLKRLADFLPPSEDMTRIRTELHEIVRRHNEGGDGKGRRWGITLGHCAGGPCHIDMKFWKVGSSTAKYIVVPLLFLVPVVLLLIRDMKNRKEKEEQEQTIKDQKQAHAAVLRASERREEAYARARDEALTQGQRAEALERAQAAEREEREAERAEQRLLLREIRLQDLSVLWEDGQNAPPHLRKRDWRRCEVSKGAAGQICRAWCEGHLRRKVAIKRVLPTNASMLQRSFSLSRQGSGRLDLTDEQKFFLYLQHENIAQCYGTVAERKGVSSIVMELCKCDLRHWLSEDSFWTDKTLLQIDEQKMEVIRQVSQGLQFLHDKHVVHLDLKDGNILLDMLDDGTCGTTWKLCDFGEAVRLRKGSDQVIDTHMHDAHDTRNVTAEIASPELFDGVGVGLKADIFAFGCVMWSVLTRLEAWHWIKGAYKANAIQKAVGLEIKRPRCPESQLTDMIRLCMHHNAAMRPSAQELSDWAHKQQGGSRSRRNGRTRSASAVSNAAVVRVLEVPSNVLLGDASEQSWSDSVPGLLSCEGNPIPPVHGCAFQVTCSDGGKGELTIRTTKQQAEELVTEEAVQALFEDCDEDHNGALDRSEIRRLLNRGGIEWSPQLEQELEGEWAALAQGSDEHEVDFPSFFRWWTTPAPSGERSHLRREMHRAGMFSPSNTKVSVRFPCSVLPGWIAMDGSRSGGTGLSWDVRGQYVAKQGSTSRDEWEEEAMQEDQIPRSFSQEKEEAEANDNNQVLIRAVFGPSNDSTQKKHPKSGIIFGDDWPYVKKIQAGTPAQEIAGLQAGCKLLRIESALSADGGDAVVEGEAVLMDFNDAVPHITAERTADKPLVLTFAAAAEET